MGICLMDGYSHGPPPRGSRARRPSFFGLRLALRRVGATSIVSVGLLLELGWSFIGSMGLGLRPGGPSGPLQAASWVCGVILIATATAVAASLARPEKANKD